MKYSASPVAYMECQACVTRERGGTGFALDILLFLFLCRFVVESVSVVRTSTRRRLERSMSGWNEVRSLIRGTAVRCLQPRITSRSRTAAPQILNRNVSALPLCRRHQIELEAKKDQIRHQIRALELGRRRFSTSPRQNHGHIDPPKPGEEYDLPSCRNERGEHADRRLGCTSLSLTKIRSSIPSRSRKETTCLILRRPMTWRWKVSHAATLAWATCARQRYL